MVVIASGNEIQAHQASIEKWGLDSTTVFAIGHNGAPPLHGVTSATIMADGLVLVADAGNRRILQLSETGEIVATLGQRGTGPGDFEWISTVSALGDTVFAFDGAQNRVTVWVPDQAGLRVVRLPRVNGFLTEFHGALSASTWILGTFEATTRGSHGLRNVFATVVAFDVPTREVTVLDRLQVRYEYHMALGGLVTSSRLDFLGSSHIGVTGDLWFAVPMDRAVIQVRALGGDVGDEIGLPVDSTPYSPWAWQEPLEGYLKGTGSDESRIRVRTMYDDLERELPDKSAPPVRRALSMGATLWVEKFGRTPGEPSTWFVTNPGEGTIRASITVDDKTTLLGGTERQAVLLRRSELGEEILEVRAVRPVLREGPTLHYLLPSMRFMGGV